MRYRGRKVPKKYFDSSCDYESKLASKISIIKNFPVKNRAGYLRDAARTSVYDRHASYSRATYDGRLSILMIFCSIPRTHRSMNSAPCHAAKMPPCSSPVAFIFTWLKIKFSNALIASKSPQPHNAVYRSNVLPSIYDTRWLLLIIGKRVHFAFDDYVI